MLNIKTGRTAEPNRRRRSAIITAVGLRLMTVVVAGIFATSVVGPVFGQRDFYGDARGLVAQTQRDIQQAADTVRRHGREMNRVDFAMRHLSQFDRQLSRGRFDKDKLDAAIDDVKNLVDHNTLEPEDRDRLTADLHDLRELRRDRGRD